MNERVAEFLETMDEEALYPTGYEDAIIGYGERCGDPRVIVLDREKCIQKDMASGMTREEAVDWFEFNVVGAFMGDYTPVFVTLLEDM